MALVTGLIRKENGRLSEVMEVVTPFRLMK